MKLLLDNSKEYDDGKNNSYGDSKNDSDNKNDGDSKNGGNHEFNNDMRRRKAAASAIRITAMMMQMKLIVKYASEVERRLKEVMISSGSSSLSPSSSGYSCSSLYPRSPRSYSPLFSDSSLFSFSNEDITSSRCETKEPEKEKEGDKEGEKEEDKEGEKEEDKEGEKEEDKEGDKEGEGQTEDPFERLKIEVLRVVNTVNFRAGMKIYSRI
jgi:hypothetical protein